MRSGMGRELSMVGTLHKFSQQPTKTGTTADLLLQIRKQGKNTASKQLNQYKASLQTLLSSMAEYSVRTLKKPHDFPT